MYKYILFVFIISVFSTAAFASTPLERYSFFGSIAALAETCYGSKLIPEKLNPAIKKVVSENPSSSDVYQALIAEYNAAYKKTLLDHLPYYISKASYSNKAINCSNESHIKFIKNQESLILSTLSE